MNRVASDPLTPVVVKTTLSDFTPGQPYYLGFTATTGFRTESHELSNVTITFPTPRCL